jgi:hypothetical protein
MVANPPAFSPTLNLALELHHHRKLPGDDELTEFCRLRFDCLADPERGVFALAAETIGNSNLDEAWYTREPVIGGDEITVSSFE